MDAEPDLGHGVLSPVIQNSSDEDQWSAENVECYTSTAIDAETVQVTR